MLGLLEFGYTSLILSLVSSRCFFFTHLYDMESTPRINSSTYVGQGQVENNFKKNQTIILNDVVKLFLFRILILMTIKLYWYTEKKLLE